MTEIMRQGRHHAPDASEASAPVLMFVRMPHVAFGDAEDEWNTWYNTVHVTPRIAVPGVRGAHRFKRLAGPFDYVTFYEADDGSVFDSEGYQAVRRHEAALPETSWERRTGALPGFARNLYEPVSGPNSFESLAGIDVLLGIGMNPASSSSDHAWSACDQLVLPAVAPKLAAGWRFHLNAGERGTRTDRRATPDCLVLYPVEEREPVEVVDLVHTTLFGSAAKADTGVTDGFAFAARRVPGNRRESLNTTK